jgi:propanediol utilization protein
MVNGVTESTSVDSLLKQFQNKTLEVVDGKGIVISGSAIVGTGAQINLYEKDKIIDSVSVVVLGDVDGNGIVDTTDIVRVKAAFLGSFMLDDAESNAADVDGNGIIDTTDYMRVMSHFLGSYDLYE